MATPNQPTMQNRNKILEIALTGLQNALVASRFYSAASPEMHQALKQAYEEYLILEKDERIASSGFVVTDMGLALENNIIGYGNPAVGYVAKLLGGHRICSLKRLAGFSPSSFAAFIKLISADPEIVRQKGGIAKLWNSSSLGSAYAVEVGPPKKLTRHHNRADLDVDWGNSLSAGNDSMVFADPRIVNRIKNFQNEGDKGKMIADVLLRLGFNEGKGELNEKLRRVELVVSGLIKAQQYRTALQIITFLYREGKIYISLGNQAHGEKILGVIKLFIGGQYLAWLTQHNLLTVEDDSEAEITEYIIRIMADEAIIHLINALSMERSKLGRRRLISALISIGKPALPYAVRMLGDQRWYVVRNMVSVIGGIGDPSALPPLKSFVTESDTRIVREVVRALGKFHTGDALNILLEYVHHPDPAIIKLAVGAISSNKSVHASKLLMDLYERLGTGAEDMQIKLAIFEVAHKLPQGQIIEWIDDVLDQNPMLKKPMWEELQVAGAKSLSLMNSPRARSSLEKHKGHKNPAVKAAVAQALAGD